jgi:hypothetical protein
MSEVLQIGVESLDPCRLQLVKALIVIDPMFDRAGIVGLGCRALQALELFLGCLCAFTKFTLAFLLLCTLGLLGVT